MCYLLLISCSTNDNSFQTEHTDLSTQKNSVTAPPNKTEFGKLSTPKSKNEFIKELYSRRFTFFEGNTKASLGIHGNRLGLNVDGYNFVCNLNSNKCTFDKQYLRYDSNTMNYNGSPLKFLLRLKLISNDMLQIEYEYYTNNNQNTTKQGVLKFIRQPK